MDGLLSLLLFAVLFFVMMRFGCGAHIMHGGHGSHGGHQDGDSPAGGSSRDPVCGMSVAPDKGYGMSWSGRTYRFCSRRCLDQFEAAPDKFKSAADQKT